jgi:CheY-like chemotaxis protein
MQQSQRLESLGQLAGGVAQDFNNLLAVITNYTAFVAEEVHHAVSLDPGRWTPVASDLEQVLRAAKRAAELTHQLLAFGRREVVRPRVIALNEVIEQITPMLRRTLGEHIELVTDLAEGLWSVKADGGQLEQVLVNLAVNARDAMPSGGTLTIATTNRDTTHDGAMTVVEGDHVVLRVCDTGTGMRPEVRARAFEPFFTTKARGEGSGLGLATVYGIVTQAGGDLRLESDVGAGTNITVLLPRTSDVAADPDREPNAGDRTHVATILLVEDEPAMREVTRRMLERLGHRVITAAGGEEALGLAAEHRGQLDLLLTDVVMPQMLGKDLADQIVCAHPGTPVLFMSGYAQPVLAAQGTLAEGVHLLEKPFTSEQLSAKVHEVLDG